MPLSQPLGEFQGREEMSSSVDLQPVDTSPSPTMAPSKIVRRRAFMESQ